MNDNVHKNDGNEEFHTLKLADYVRILRRRWWIVLLSTLISLGLAAYMTSKTKPVYWSSATIMIQDDGGMQRVLFDEQGTYLSGKSTIDDQVYLLKSRSIAELVVKELLQSNVRDSLKFLNVKFEYAVEVLRGMIYAQPVKGTNFFIEISAWGSSPFEASYIANTVATVYQDQDQKLGQGEIREVVEFLDEQLKNKEQDLKESEENFKNFLEQTTAAGLSGDIQGMINQLASFETLYNQALTELRVYEKRLDYLNQQLGLQKENLTYNIAQVSSPLILKLREELAEIEHKASVLIAQGVLEEYADLKNLRDKQASLKKKLIAETQQLVASGLMPNDPLAHAQNLVNRIIEAETEIYTLKIRADALQQVVKKYSQKLEVVPEKSLRLARLERYKKVDENLYDMKQKLEESRISMAGQIGKVRIIDRAIEPSFPIASSKKRNLSMGTLLGLGLGVLIVMFLEFLDRSIRSIDDIEQLGFSLIGAIPHFDTESTNGFAAILTNGHDKAIDYQAKMIVKSRPQSPIAEAYRAIRTNMQFSRAGGITSILLTSPGPEEGKSTTAINLGITISKMGRKTLLIDADLRRPVIHRYFNLQKKQGLTNYLVGETASTNIVQASEVEDNLYVLTSGILPPNPSELLGSNKMKSLLENLKKDFDFILVDSPPIIAVTDAQILASEVDGVLIVIRAGKSQRDAVKRSKALLDIVNAKLFGIVLNDARAEHMYGNYHYYNQSYYGK